MIDNKSCLDCKLINRLNYMSIQYKANRKRDIQQHCLDELYGAWSETASALCNDDKNLLLKCGTQLALPVSHGYHKLNKLPLLLSYQLWTSACSGQITGNTLLIGIWNWGYVFASFVMNITYDFASWCFQVKLYTLNSGSLWLLQTVIDVDKSIRIITPWKRHNGEIPTYKVQITLLCNL